MSSILKTVLDAVFSILPDSPFRGMVDSVVLDSDLLPFLNWFIPFDTCAGITSAWLGCILVYYLFVFVKKVVIDIILPKVMSVLGIALGAGE